MRYLERVRKAFRFYSSRAVGAADISPFNAPPVFVMDLLARTSAIQELPAVETDYTDEIDITSPGFIVGFSGLGEHGLG